MSSSRSPLHHAARLAFRLAARLRAALPGALPGGRGRRLPALERRRSRPCGPDRDLPLEDCDFVVLDTELTGLSPRRDAIVAIGAVRIRGLRLRPDETFFSLVRPDRDLPKRSTLIHRITPDQLATAPSPDEVLPRFVEFCADGLLVGHHLGLDLGFLNRALRRRYGADLGAPQLDTLRLARTYEEALWRGFYDRFDLRASYRLPDLAEAFGLPAFRAHHALSDAFQAAYLFLFLVRKLRHGSLRTLRDLLAASRPQGMI